MSLKTAGNSIIASGIVPRFDYLSNKTDELNNRLVLMCEQKVSYLFLTVKG